MSSASTHRKRGNLRAEPPPRAASRIDASMNHPPGAPSWQPENLSDEPHRRRGGENAIYDCSAAPGTSVNEYPEEAAPEPDFPPFPAPRRRATMIAKLGRN